MRISLQKISPEDPLNAYLAHRIKGNGRVRMAGSQLVAEGGAFYMLGPAGDFSAVYESILRDYSPPQPLAREMRSTIIGWLSFLVDEQRRIVLIEISDPTVEVPSSPEEVGLNLYELESDVESQNPAYILVFLTGMGVREWLHDVCTQFYGLSSGFLCIGAPNSVDAFKEKPSPNLLKELLDNTEALAVQCSDYTGFVLFVEQEEENRKALLEYFV